MLVWPTLKLDKLVKMVGKAMENSKPSWRAQ